MSRVEIFPGAARVPDAVPRCAAHTAALVRLLEEYLELAKSGQLQVLGLVAVLPTGDEWQVVVERESDSTRLLGPVTALQWLLSQEANKRAYSTEDDASTDPAA